MGSGPRGWMVVIRGAKSAEVTKGGSWLGKAPAVDKRASNNWGTTESAGGRGETSIYGITRERRDETVERESRRFGR